MQTVNEKLLTELKSCPVKWIDNEVATLIDDDLRAALFDLLSQSQAAEQTDEEAANHYAECCNGGSRGSGIIQQSFLAGCQHKEKQLSKEQQQKEYSTDDVINFMQWLWDSEDFQNCGYANSTMIRVWLTSFNNLPK